MLMFCILYSVTNKMYIIVSLYHKTTGKYVQLKKITKICLPFFNKIVRGDCFAMITATIKKSELFAPKDPIRVLLMPAIQDIVGYLKYTVSI